MVGLPLYRLTSRYDHLLIGSPRCSGHDVALGPLALDSSTGRLKILQSLQATSSCRTPDPPVLETLLVA